MQGNPMTSGQRVTTPNGPGTLWYRQEINGEILLMVRHVIKDMTSQDHGYCDTPRAKVSGLWGYKEGEVK